MKTLKDLCKSIDAQMASVEAKTAAYSYMEYTDENKETIWALVDEKIKMDAALTRSLIAWAKRHEIYGAYYTEANTEDRALRLRETYRDYKKSGIHDFDRKEFAKASKAWEEWKNFYAQQ